MLFISGGSPLNARFCVEVMENITPAKIVSQVTDRLYVVELSGTPGKGIAMQSLQGWLCDVHRSILHRFIKVGCQNTLFAPTSFGIKTSPIAQPTQLAGRLHGPVPLGTTHVNKFTQGISDKTMLYTIVSGPMLQIEVVHCEA